MFVIDFYRGLWRLCKRFYGAVMLGDGFPRVMVQFGAVVAVMATLAVFLPGGFWLMWVVGFIWFVMGPYFVRDRDGCRVTDADVVAEIRRNGQRDREEEHAEHDQTEEADL